MHLSMQYTLRNIPKTLDTALRRRAKQEKKTLNEIALEVMADGLGLQKDPKRRRSLSDIAGAQTTDPGLEAALDDQRRIDAELWR